LLRSLRARLVATLLVLLLAVGLVVGVITAVALNAFLLQQVDERLQAARFVVNELVTGGTAGNPGPEPRPPEAGRPEPRALPPLTLGALVVDGRVETAGVTDNAGVVSALTAADESKLATVPSDRAPRTVGLAAGDYRVVAVRTPDGAVVVSGFALAETQATVQRLVLIEVIVIGSALLLAGIAGTVLVRRSLRPLGRVAATAGRVAQLPLDRGEVALAERVSPADSDPRSEVGQVGQALNRMLGHVEAALESRQASETRLRRFVADASHELRTPLSAIRGYTELSRRRSADVPAEVEHALGRVAAATERMTTLVEDLLLLARLDAGRPLEVQPVDLSAIVVDAVSDAHIAGPEHRWQLDAPRTPVTVTGDAERLAQVLANLLANARTHTPAGTTVAVRLAAEPGAARIEVSDDGPGIPAELLPRVFERFARGNGGRARTGNGTGSTGLGLSIVDAVVAAHGGSVRVDSRPGRTTFSVVLPAGTGAPAR
jgi:two-component system OmpR family sensor kinase